MTQSKKPFVPQDKSLSKCPGCNLVPMVKPRGCLPPEELIKRKVISVYCDNLRQTNPLGVCGQEFLWWIKDGRITVKK